MHLPRYFKKIYEILQKRLESDVLDSLCLAFKDLYAIDVIPIKPEKIELLNTKIKETYQDPNYIYDTLIQRLNITNIILDIINYNKN